MNNIFENAYFGKVYKTRDGRKAIYMECNLYDEHILIVQNSKGYHYEITKGATGRYFEEEPTDIISEWTIDEEELDELVEEYAQIELGYSDIEMKDFDSWSSVAQAKFREVCEDFKAGFRAKEAMEEDYDNRYDIL